jgi:hypothetical protein
VRPASLMPRAALVMTKSCCGKTVMACLGLITVIHFRHVYTRSKASIVLPQHLAPSATAPRSYRNTRGLGRTTSEHSSSARNPRMQKLHTKTTKTLKCLCAITHAEQRLRGAFGVLKHQCRQLKHVAQLRVWPESVPMSQILAEAPGEGFKRWLTFPGQSKCANTSYPSISPPIGLGHLGQLGLSASTQGKSFFRFNKAMLTLQHTLADVKCALRLRGPNNSLGNRGVRLSGLEWCRRCQTNQDINYRAEHT